MAKNYPSEALNKSYQYKLKITRFISAMLVCAALIGVSLYAALYFSLPPVAAAAVTVVGIVAAVTVVALGFLMVRKAFTTLNAQ